MSWCAAHNVVIERHELERSGAPEDSQQRRPRPIPRPVYTRSRRAGRRNILVRHLGECHWPWPAKVPDSRPARRSADRGRIRRCARHHVMSASTRGCLATQVLLETETDETVPTMLGRAPSPAPGSVARPWRGGHDSPQERTQASGYRRGRVPTDLHRTDGRTHHVYSELERAAPGESCRSAPRRKTARTGEGRCSAT